MLEKRPAEARARVAQAIRSVREDPHPRPLTGNTKLSTSAQKEFMQRTARDRGLLIWRTLETVIDRERVDRALALYEKQDHSQGDSAGAFRAACEAISGRNLRWFFDYYVAGTRLPRITLRRISGNAPNEVSGEILVGDAPPEFQVRVEMRLQTAGGVIEHSVATNGRVTPFTVTTAEPVARIIVDPDARILRRTAARQP